MSGKAPAPELKDMGVSHPCPRDGVRGCLAMVHATRLRCRFCQRTIVLRDRA